MIIWRGLTCSLMFFHFNLKARSKEKAAMVESEMLEERKRDPLVHPVLSEKVVSMKEERI